MVDTNLNGLDLLSSGTISNTSSERSSRSLGHNDIGKTVSILPLSASQLQLLDFVSNLSSLPSKTTELDSKIDHITNAISELQKSINQSPNSHSNSCVEDVSKVSTSNIDLFNNI